MKKLPISLFLFWIFPFVLAACTGRKDQPPSVLLTPPAIMVEASRENCPSIETEVGMLVAWENVDTVTLPFRIEQFDSSGKITDIGRSEAAPGEVFSTQFYYAGIYHVYCSENPDVYGTITVK